MSQGVEAARSSNAGRTPLVDRVQDASLSLLEVRVHDGEGSELGLWFGATSGEVFGSADAGRTWTTVAPRLAPVTSVRAS